MSVRPIPVIAVSAILAFVLAGCDSRSAQGLPENSIVAGGIGTRFYAQVPHAEKEGDPPRIYVFRTLAAYDKFVATWKYNELGFRRFMNEGADGATLIVEEGGKDDPALADTLVAEYHARNGG